MPSHKLDEYEVISTIGSGSYGICKKIRRKCDGKIRVWKELNYGSMTDGEKQLLVSEVNLLRELKHNHIVRYHDRIIDKTSTTIYIIMEFCEGGDLSQLINKHKKDRCYMDEPFVWKVLYQLSLALKECHRRSTLGCTVLHRDLKPANVFLTSSGDVKLGDFGLARVLHHETSFAKTFVGTPYYMSPEQFSRTSYNEKSDIWSLGCLLYELCALLPPFLAANERALAVKVQDGCFKPLPHQYSADLQLLIQALLTVDDDRRPSIDDVLNWHLVKRNLQLGAGKERRQSSVPANCDPIQRREEMLKLKEMQLNEKERLLEHRENVLKERERVAEDKLARAESMVSELCYRDYYPIQKRHTKVDKENVCPDKEPVLPMRRRNLDSESAYMDVRHGKALRFLENNLDACDRRLELKSRLRKDRLLAL